jgi:hypothetical protein
MMTKMGAVMPVVQKMQQHVIDKYGFGSVMEAVGAVQQHAHADENLARKL